MSTQEETRQLMTKERQHQEHLKETMLSRAVEEMETQTTEETTEEARELIARQRQDDKQLEEKMLSRTRDEIK